MQIGDRVIIRRPCKESDGEIGNISSINNKGSIDDMSIEVILEKFKWPITIYNEKELEIIPPSLKEISKKHHKWIKKMGWNKQLTPLEQLMMIVSECGEAANECRGERPTELFRYELADIILRTLGLVERYKIDMDKTIQEKMEINRQRGPKGRIK